MKPSFKDRVSSSDSQISDYLRILKEDPKSRVFAPLAEALIRKGRLDEAREICRTGLEANPSFSDGHLAYARVLYFLFQHEDAMQEVRLTLGLDDSNVAAYLLAAEVFLSRSQFAAATQACMKALDLDPENTEVRSLLKRTAPEKEMPEAAEGISMTTGTFRATAGTAPSRRLMDSDEPASMSDPFKELLQSAGRKDHDQIDREDVRFSSLSPGSYPTIPAHTTCDDSSFDVPTRKEESRKSPEDKPVPQLPAHPTLPADALFAADLGAMSANGSVDLPPPVAPPSPHLDPNTHWPAESESSTEPPQADSHPVDSGDLRVVENVQAVIDHYAERMPTNDLDSLPLKMPRSGRALAVFLLLAAIAVVGALVLLSLPSDDKPEPAQAKPSPPGSDQAAIGPVEPRPPAQTDHQAIEATDTTGTEVIPEATPPEPSPIPPKAKVKKASKKRRRRKTRRRKKSRRKTKRRRKR